MLCKFKFRLPELRETCASCLGRIALMSVQPNNGPANFIPEERYPRLFVQSFERPGLLREERKKFTAHALTQNYLG